LELNVLGYPQVYADGTKLKLPTQKAAAILYFLAVHGRASRDELAELLWEADARHRLRPELHRLRKLPGADTWLELDDTAAIHLPIDLTDFTNHLRAERYNEALALHPERGYLLQGFSVDDAPQFMDWLDRERERVASMYNRALYAAAENARRAGDVPKALHLAQQLIHLDELDESAYRLAMRLEYTRGHIQAALRYFEICRRMLTQELGIEPLEETQSLARDIEQGQALPAFAVREQVRLPNTLLRPPSLIAREDTWARMEDAYQAGQIIFLSGPAGVGKTRLLLDFATSKGPFILSEGKLADKYAPLSSQARVIQRYFDAYPDSLPEPSVVDVLAEFRLPTQRDDITMTGSMPSDRDKTRLVRALTAFLEHTTQHFSVYPSDNIHLFDPVSADLSQRAASIFFERTVSQAKHVCAVNTFRQDNMPDGFESMLTQFVDHGLAVHLELSPLSLAGLNELLASLKINVPADFAVKLHAATGGNPQHVIETLKSLYRNRQLDGLPDTIRLPEHITQTLTKRLNALSTLALRVAKAVATIEHTLNTEQLASLLELDAFDIAEATAELERAQIFVDDWFVHDVLQTKASELTAAAVKRHLHKRMGQLLEQDYFHPDNPRPNAAQIAHHYLAADEHNQALPWRVRATEDAIGRGFLAQGSRWLKDILFDAPNDSESYARAHVLKGRLLLNQDLAAAEACFQEAFALSEYLFTELEVASLVGLALCAKQRGAFGEASSYIDQALEYPLTDAQRAQLHNTSGLTLLQAGQYQDAEPILKRAVKQAPDAPSYQLDLAALLWHQGRFEELVQMLLRLAKRNPPQHLHTRLYYQLGSAYRMLGRPREALTWVQQSIQAGEDTYDSYSEGLSHLGAGSVHVMLGHSQTALEHYQHGEKLFQDIGLMAFVAEAKTRYTQLYMCTGDVRHARDASLQACQLLERYNRPYILSQALTGLAHAELALGNFSASQQILAEAWELVKRLEHPFASCRLHLVSAYSHLTHEDYAQAHTSADALAKLAKQHKMDAFLAEAILLHAKLSKQDLRRDLAQQAFELAAQHGLGWLRYNAASYLVDLGDESYVQAKADAQAYLEKHKNPA
jgi:DNA-binding SARP family transcriptional activator